MNMRPFSFKTFTRSKNETREETNISPAALYHTLCPFTFGKNWNLKDKRFSLFSALPV